MPITFNNSDAEHIYELCLGHFSECGQCQIIKKRLEKFIGEEEVRSIKRIIKKYPYCK
jgi:hypothetical protein